MAQIKSAIAPTDKASRLVEAITAGLLTIAAIWLHYLFAVFAGALWRDESSTVGLATLPNALDIWKNLQNDSFPVLWIGVLRGFAATFGHTNDAAFRVLGSIVGISLIASLWLNTRAFGGRSPVIGLALFALSPTVVRWGDSMRAYGLGLTFIVLTNALVWRFVAKPSSKRFFAATVFALLSVQTLYYNSVLLLAMCAGGVAVFCFRHDWARALQIVAMGLIAALSLIPYVEVFDRAAEWNQLLQVPSYSAEWFWIKLFEAVIPSGEWAFEVWGSLIAVALLIGIFGLLAPRMISMNKAERETALYILIVLVIGALGSFMFLRILRYYSQPWYYLTVLLIAALATDVLLGLMSGAWPRTILSLTALAIGIGTLLNAPLHVATRMTNGDVVAGMLETIAVPSDLIVVNPWYEGVTFNRYYHGRAKWISIPDIPSPRFHRYDLVLQFENHERSKDSLQSTFSSIRQALVDGNTVYFVGAVPRAAASPQASTRAFPSAADQGNEDERELDISNLLLHAVTIAPVAVQSFPRVNPYESMALTSVRGWKQ